MGDSKEVFQALKKSHHRYKDKCLKENMNTLNGLGIEYEVFNLGYHLKVKLLGNVIDFWPSTNKWMWDKKTYHGNAGMLIKWVNRYLGEER